MARAPTQETLRGSLIDRLTGDHGANTAFGAISHRDLKRALQRHLNWLLNTRAWFPEDLEEYPEVQSSMLAYGLPDFTTLSWKSVGDRETICKIIEESVRAFEPRLVPRTVSVSAVDEEDEEDGESLFVRLRVEGILNIEPFTEPVSFDTDVEIDSGFVNVKGAT